MPQYVAGGVNMDGLGPGVSLLFLKEITTEAHFFCFLFFFWRGVGWVGVHPALIGCLCVS